MVSAGDIKKGITIQWNNGVWLILDFQHVKPGKGAAFVRTKLKNVMNGVIRDETFNPSEKFPKAHIETKEMEYLYSDGELYHFMDIEDFEQIPVSADQVEEAIQYIRENDTVTMRFYQGKPFEVLAPNFVELKVVHTEPGFKGDTSQGVYKAATVETGAIIQVPLFVEIDDKIKIDTRTGEYLS